MGTRRTKRKKNLSNYPDAQQKVPKDSKTEKKPDPLSVLISKRPRFKKPISVEKLEKLSEDR